MKFAIISEETNLVTSVVTEKPEDNVEGQYYVWLHPRDKVEIGAEWGPTGFISGFTKAPPDEVGGASFRVALLEMGVATTEAELDTIILGVIDGLPVTDLQKEQYRILWRRASGIKRDFGLVAVIQAVLQKDDDWMDQVFHIAGQV